MSPDFSLSSPQIRKPLIPQGIKLPKNAFELSQPANLKIPTQRATSTSGPEARLDLAYPDSREAIQHNLHLVAEALSDGRIDTALANTYNRIYRTAEQNLHRWERAQEKARKQAQKQGQHPPEKTQTSSLQMPSLSSDIPTKPEEPTLSPAP